MLATPSGQGNTVEIRNPHSRWDRGLIQQFSFAKIKIGGLNSTTLTGQGRHDRPRIGAWLAACGLAFLPAIVTATGLSAMEMSGKALYLGGIGASGRPAKTFIGAESTVMTADIVPCGSCHGEDGRGRPEGGIVPTDITWRYLTKPYGHSHADNRHHPAFTEKSLASAIARGIDPAGNRLDPTMPRYALGRKDMAALVAYLKRLETDLSPGLTEDTIRVGTILPLKGQLAATGEEAKAVLAAYFDTINAQGGIYGRKIELHVAEVGDTRAATLANARQLLAEKPVFAVVSAFAVGVDKEMAELMEREAVPNVGSLTLFPQEVSSGRQYSFFIWSGIKEQARVLVDYASQNLSLPNPRAATLYPGDGLFTETLYALESQAKLHHWNAPVRVEYAPGRFDAAAIAGTLSQSDTGAVFFLGSGAELKSFLDAAKSIRWNPYLLLPGSMLDGDILGAHKDLTDRLFLALPTLPSDRSREGVTGFKTLREKFGFSTRHLATEVSAYCAAQVLVQGLKLAGREVSRKKLVTALEGLYDYDTGLTPKLRYGPNQHIGALGAYMVTLDKKTGQIKPASDWMVPK
jgi:ABC-type branched-subunit amino acid transport system substrate-binding protein